MYGASKLYNIMVAKALNEKLKGTGVEAFSAHPGESSLQRICVSSSMPGPQHLSFAAPKMCPHWQCMRA